MLKGALRFKWQNEDWQRKEMCISDEIVEVLYEKNPKKLLHLKNELKHYIEETLESRWFDITDFGSAIARLNIANKKDERTVKMIMYFEKFSTKNWLDDDSLKLLVKPEL